MLVGYNNNITYKGKVYHVQTEDSGLKNPIIVTLLYYKGTILSSKKTEYSHLIGTPDMNASVRELMKEQHKAMLKELISGKYATSAEKVVAEESAAVIPRGEPAKAPTKKRAETLDDILLDYIIKKEKK